MEERQGFTGRTTTFQNMLVFRRPLGAEAAAAEEPRLALPPAEQPAAAAEAPAPQVAEPDPAQRPVLSPEPRIVETLTRGPTDRPMPRLVADRREARAEAPRPPAE